MEQFDNFFYKLDSRSVSIVNPLHGQHGFASLDFDKFTTARLELSVHSQLLGYKYTPGSKPKSFGLSFLKDKTAPETSKSFEEFMAGIIKDKPANIDAFFDGYVKLQLDSVMNLRDYCRDVVFLTDGKLEPEIEAKLKVVLVQISKPWMIPNLLLLKILKSMLLPKEAERILS